MNIQFDGQQVIIPIDKAILVLTRQQFLEVLRRGKAWRQRQLLTQRPTTHDADEPHRLPTGLYRAGTCRPPNAPETTRLHGLVEHV